MVLVVLVLAVLIGHLLRHDFSKLDTSIQRSGSYIARGVSGTSARCRTEPVPTLNDEALLEASVDLAQTNVAVPAEIVQMTADNRAPDL